RGAGGSVTFHSRCERTVSRYRRWIQVAACAVALALPVTVSVQSGPEPSGGRGWSTVMGDLGNRYSTLDQINTQNVSRLGAVWTSERLTPPANSRSMTVVKNGMMYFTAPPNVLKIDARTGKTVWRFTTGGGGRRGVCAGDGLPRSRGCSRRRWSRVRRDVRRARHRAPRRHGRAAVEPLRR